MRKLSRYKRFLGLPLVYAGVVELFLCYVFNLTRFNVLLLLGWLMVTGGIVGYVILLKKDSIKNE
jgi:hypothetical protein